MSPGLQFLWPQELQTSLLALRAAPLQILPGGGCSPLGYSCSWAPYWFLVNTGCRREGTKSQETVFLALPSATDACCESIVWALISSLMIKEGGGRTQRGDVVYVALNLILKICENAAPGNIMGPSQACF